MVCVALCTHCVIEPDVGQITQTHTYTRRL